MNILKYLFPTLTGMALLQGCSQIPDESPTSPQRGGMFTVQLETESLATAKNSVANDNSDNTAIRQVIGYRFSEGILREIVPGIESDAEGTYTFPLKELSGDLRFVANDETGIFSQVEPESTSLEAFLLHSTTVDRMAGDRFLMTGSTEIKTQNTTVPSIRMRRSVARIDLFNPDRGVTVHHITIRGIADKGYVNEQPNSETLEPTDKSDFTIDYTDAPLGNGRETLLYLCEQGNEGLSAEAIVEFEGGLHRMVATFPAQILRNRIYTLQVHGKGADVSLSIVAEGWETNHTTEALPDSKGIIDIDSSILPGNVRVNASLDTLFISHRGGEFKLALKAEAEAEVSIEGDVRGVTATVEARTKTLEPIAFVAVSCAHRMPHEKQSYLHLNIHRDQLYSGRIVLVFEPNPVLLSGAIKLDENGICDFGRYIDGELGRITLPEGKTARLEFDPDEDPWMTLSQDGNELRILGGWKPNDPKADGRIQEGRLILSDSDESYSESYSIRRRNQGLPVVKIGETWWCKYNLRGHVKTFEDQISIQADPAINEELADYLNDCNEEELLRLMGDQYQGGNQQGLPLRHDGTAFYHEGMLGSAQNFGTLDPTYMAPDGYQLPDYDDYAFFSGSNNYNIGGVGSRTYQNGAGDEISVRIIERDASFLGEHYGIVSLYEFRSGTGCWILYGLGHQWNTSPGSISRMTLLLATYGNSANSWIMEGYAQNDRPNQNWLKFVNQNSTKTRVIRCIKSPVEYIYE